MPMAVEAQHLRLFKANTSARECIDNYNLVDFADDYAILDPSSTSCVTMSNGAVVSRKRPSDMIDINRQIMLEDDFLVAQHVEKMRAKMMEGKIRFARQVISLVDERVSKRLRAKDEEIEQMKKLNLALEEKIKTLVTENQVWQYLAQTNEAAANALRTNLQHVLSQQQIISQQQQRTLVDEDDAESCCGDNFEEVGSTTKKTVGDRRKNVCRSCYAQEPSVLLLPCRHLCLCATCARATDACPICKCCRTGSVNVNLA